MKKLDLVFIFLAISGFLLNLIEIFLKIFNRSICEKESCRIVSQYVKFGDEILIVSGLVVFFILAIISILNLKLKNNKFDILIDIILIASLSAEGYLTGFQFFRVKILCSFCLSVFFIFVALSIVRIANKKILSALGFIVYFSVITMIFIIKPSNISSIPKLKHYNLFYSKNCPHCKNVMNFSEKNRITLNYIDADKYKDFLVAFSIEEVPTLIVKKDLTVLIIKGDKEIINFLKKEKATTKPARDSKTNTCKLGVINCN